jgi:hypothetical protein
MQYLYGRLEKIETSMENDDVAPYIYQPKQTYDCEY